MGIKQIKLFLFCCIFAFIISTTIKDISLTEEEEAEIKDHKESEVFLLEISPEYYSSKNLHIKVESENNPIILVGDDEQCNNRKAVGLQPNNPINLFIQKEEIQSTQNLYVCVSCRNEDNCLYTIKFKLEEICELGLGEQISFYAKNINRLTFKFEDKTEQSSSFKRNLSTVKNAANIWVKGQNIKTVNLQKEGGDEYFDNSSFDFGYIFMIKEIDEYKPTYLLDIDLKDEDKEDYITIGSIYIRNELEDNYDSINELHLNDLEMMGILNQEIKNICFPIKKIDTEEILVAQVNGRIMTNKAKVYFSLGDEEILSEEINNGLIFEHLILNKEDNAKFCVTYPNSDNKQHVVIFELQLTKGSNEKYSQFIYPPQLPGVIYSHFLLKGEIAVFRGMKPKNGAKEINFNMKTIKGFPDMLFDWTNDFPYSVYDDNKIKNIKTNPRHANRMTVYSIYLNDNDYKEFNPLSEIQPLIVVQCIDGVTDEKENTVYCEFETSIFTDLDRINLIRDETFSQYLLEKESDLYTINIENEENLEKVYLDLIVFSGDVNFEIENSNDLQAHKYYLSNKIFYSIKVNSNNKKIDFKVEAKKNSFYLVMYKLVYSGDQSKNINKIESGLNYIQSIAIGREKPDYLKYIEIENLKFEQQNPFLINFYSQNCKFMISRNKLDDDGNETEEPEYFPMEGSYGQLIIDKTDNYYFKKDYKFKIDIIDDDLSEYNNKLCMIYVSGLELSNSNEGTERTISVSEGVPQFYIFTNKYQYMKYTYFVTDVNKQLVISFNLVQKGTFKIGVSHHYDTIIDTTIYRNEQILINKEKLKEVCKGNEEVCPFDIFITLMSNEEERRLETTIYQIDGAPFYLEKNVIKQDILLGSTKKYYYLDIGPNEEGDITIDYIRGSGYNYAKIVDKNNPKDQTNPDWRGLYEFPKSKDDSIYFERYLKKIPILKTNTENCSDGCYVLITVQSAVNDEDNEQGDSNLTPYRITITPRIFPIGYQESASLIPRVAIPINQFIVGDVFKTKQTFTFYQINLPYDSDYVIIDWQADKPSLFIDIEKYNFDENMHDFNFESVGHDTVFRIEKEKIISKYQEKYKINIPTIKNITLILGINTKELDTLYTSPFAFKIFMPPKRDNQYDTSIIEIIHIRSDQKVQCDPSFEDGVYKCVFAVIFDEGDIDKDVIVFPRAQIEDLKVDFYGYIVDAEEVEKNNIKFISEQLKNEDKKYDSQYGIKYIYYENIDKKKCILFSVSVNSKSTIEVLSSIYKYSDDKVIVPNPTTPQIFAIGSNRIKLNFETSKDLLINIVSINGYGNFYWEEEEGKDIKYYVNDLNDRLTLTSGTFENEKRFSKLVVQSSTFTFLRPDNSGFVFYLSYYPRNPMYHFDQLKIGRSTEFNYRNISFPLNYIAKLNNNKGVSLSLTFYDYYMKDQSLFKYDSKMFDIWGKVIPEKEALDARVIESQRPTKENSISGSFDGAFAYLYFDENTLQANEIESPYIFFTVEPKEGIEDIDNFKGLSLEVSLLNDEDFIPEDVYISGKLSKKEEKYNPSIIYKLKKTNSKQYFMRIEFAANSGFVKWDVFADDKLTKNITTDKNFRNGRSYMTVPIPDNLENNCLYLKVYNDDNIEINHQLSNFVFKYVNGLTEKDFSDFPQAMDVLNYKITKETGINKVHISFYPVTLFMTHYYLKITYKDKKIYGEIDNTIAITESDGYYLQLENSQPDENGKSHLYFEMPDAREISSIKIIAKVSFTFLTEYILYKPIYIDIDDILPYNPYDEGTPSQYLITKQYEESTRQTKVRFKDAYKIQQFKLDFSDVNQIPNYIKVKVDSKDNRNQILSFSPTDPLGKDNRLQLAQSGYGQTVNMWIKKEQFESNKNLYTTVECQVNEGETCNYDIIFVGYDVININSLIFTYNYYVSENNKKMEFSIVNDLGISQFDGQVLTLYANGGKKIKIMLEDCRVESCQQYEFRTGAAISTTIQEKSHFKFTIEAEEGDFISVGSKVTYANETSYQNVLRPNAYQFTGYLKKDVLNKECYYINGTDSNEDSYIVGIFYNKIAEISFKDENYGDLEDTNELITTGYYSYVHDNNKNNRKYICIGFPKLVNYNNREIRDIPYSLQLTQPSQDKGLLNFYGPQLRGNIYPRIITKGSVVFFNGANINSESDKIIYNMITIEGLPKMYIYKCTNYPLCHFNELNKDEINEISEINRMSSWYNKGVNNSSPIDAEQYIMFVKCEDSDNPATNICQFQTSIYGNKDEIYLIEGQSFSQYILSQQSTKYVIEWLENNIKKVHIDVFIISGDVKLDLIHEDKENVVEHKYYLANKIFYSVNLGESTISKITVDIEAKVNTYYIIEYKFVRNSDSELSNDIYTGINYLVPILPEGNANRKVINIHNIKLEANEFYFASFYSLNCQFKITKKINGKEEQISSFINYAQDVIHNEDGEDIDMHSYIINVVEKDSSNYNNNMCMLYVTGLEITQKDDSISQKEILMSEGVPQRTIFQHKLSKIKYIYPNPDKNKSLSIYFKVINPANYICNITCGNKSEETIVLYRSEIYYLNKLLMSDCGENELCTIIVSLAIEEEYEEFVPAIEVTFKQINNNPYYIPKGIVKQDYVSGNSLLYLYTTLGKDDEGYINVDFDRGSGFVYAKIVEFEKVENNPDWRQYTFPKTVDESLYYEFYNKRITFKKEDTSKCGNGCYLLIAIQSSVKGKMEEEYKHLLFSILVSLTQSENLREKGTIIEIEPEKYVIGSLSNQDKMKNKDMYEFYQIIIPYDADKVEFDWQSESSILLVNIGEERPTIENHHFMKEFRDDSVFELTNGQIRDHLIAGNYITNALLTIGIYTEDLQTELGTPYSFRVHFSKELNIYKVYSDQKTLCKPNSIGNNEYECLFMVIYDGLDFINDLMIYSRSQSPSALTYMYGEFISSDIYDSFNSTELNDKKPNEASTYNTKREKVDFIFLTLSELDSHFYVKVITDKPDNVEFITSFKTFDTELSPNPSSIQLFTVHNSPSMTLKFITTKPLLINIVSLYGSSKIYLKDQPDVEYSLRGRDDRLSLAIPYDKTVSILNILNLNYESEDKELPDQSVFTSNNENKIQMPGFAFYIEYYLRSPIINLDEIYIGKTVEFAYKQSDLYLHYYSKLTDLSNSINVFFMIHDLNFGKEGSGIKQNNLELKGGIIEQKDVYNIKNDKNIEKPHLNVEGIYDPIIEVGQISFDKAYMNLYENLNKSTLYLSIEKTNNAEFTLDKVRIELTAFQEDKDIPVTEKLYQYGKVFNKSAINYYRLKVDNTTGYMRIQFSRKSKYILYAINNEKNIKKNYSYEEWEVKEKRGKIFITFKKPVQEYIYLNVFLSEEAPENDNKLNNYVFKYMNSDDKAKFFEYPILNDNSKIKVNINEDNLLTVKFNRIDSKADIIYTLKVAKQWDLSSKEENSSIALSETESLFKKEFKPSGDEITMELDNIYKDYTYIEVIAQIKDGPIIEYVAYEPFYNSAQGEKEKEKEKEKGKEEEKGKENEKEEKQETPFYKKTEFLIIVIAGSVIFIILIILIIIILVYNCKAKDLYDQVNKISFVQEDKKGENNNNLLLDDKNELE